MPILLRRRDVGQGLPLPCRLGRPQGSPLHRLSYMPSPPSRRARLSH